MKRSTNFNGMRRYRNLGLEDFVETCKAVGMTDDEIIAAVKDMKNPPNKSLNTELPTAANGETDELLTI